MNTTQTQLPITVEQNTQDNLTVVEKNLIKVFIDKYLYLLRFTEVSENMTISDLKNEIISGVKQDLYPVYGEKTVDDFLKIHRKMINDDISKELKQSKKEIKEMKKTLKRFSAFSDKLYNVRQFNSFDFLSPNEIYFSDSFHDEFKKRATDQKTTWDGYTGYAMTGHTFYKLVQESTFIRVTRRPILGWYRIKLEYKN